MAEEQKDVVIKETPAKKQGAPTGVIILLLIVFFPVGLLLMWLKKSWKLWVKIVISALFLVIIIGSVSGGDSKSTTASESASNNAAATEETITYEAVDLQTMIDELNENALRAENTYQDKYVEVTGNIANFDSDGAYISLEPMGDEWTLTSVMCYIKTPEQKDYLLSKNVGDTVTVKGKIKSIGEVLGYSIDIDSIE